MFVIVLPTETLACVIVTFVELLLTEITLGVNIVLEELFPVKIVFAVKELFVTASFVETPFASNTVLPILILVKVGAPKFNQPVPVH